MRGEGFARFVDRDREFVSVLLDPEPLALPVPEPPPLGARSIAVVDAFEFRNEWSSPGVIASQGACRGHRRPRPRPPHQREGPCVPPWNAVSPQRAMKSAWLP